MSENQLEIDAITICSDIEDFHDSYNLGDVDNEDDLQVYLEKLGDLKRDFRRIFSQLKVILKEGFEAKYPGYEQNLAQVRSDFKEAQSKLNLMKDEEKAEKEKGLMENARDLELAEKARIEQEMAEKARIEKEILTCAKSLMFEIEIRHDTLMLKCSVDVEKLSDYEILEYKGKEDNLHIELRELIDKVSSFEKYVFSCGPASIQLREKAIAKRDACSEGLRKFLKKLREVQNEKDISEKKLKNSLSLEIKLPKFTGYHCSTDIFTFRSEFKKLVEPFVQKCFWADYLKKNYLDGTAHNLVCKIDDIDEIWKKLIDVYGDTRVLLQNKLTSLESFSKLEKLKDDEKITSTITSLLNSMMDLQKLAEEFHLENELYYGGGVHKVLELLGRERERKFIKSIASEKIGDVEKWQKLVTFLENERKEREAYILNEKVRKSINLERLSNKDREKKRDKDHEESSEKSKVFNSDASSKSSDQCVCHICGKGDDHVLSFDASKTPFIEYIACKSFAEKAPKDRDQLIFKKRFCGKCLKPGVKWNAEHSCDRQYSCNQNYKNKSGVITKCEKHVLICGFHCKEGNNKDLLDSYKKNVIDLNGKFQDFTKNISLFSECYGNTEGNDEEDYSIFAFQRIDIEGTKFNIFYDSGCGDLVVRKEAVDKLMQIDKAKHVSPGPITLNGVANQESVCKHGLYSITLPLKNKDEATLTGVCVDEVTLPFPEFPLESVEKDLRAQVKKSRKHLLRKLPRLSKKVGGTVDIMIGKHYLKYFPREIFRMKSGLTIYNSMFKSYDGSTGVISGPHPDFSKALRSSHFAFDKKLSYYSPAVKTYFDFLSLNGKTPLIGPKCLPTDPDLVQLFPENNCTECGEPVSLSFNSMEGIESSDLPVGGREGENLALLKRGPNSLKKFEEIENTGSHVPFRCVGCRICKDCRKGSQIEEISIRDEYEQHIINKSVTVDIEKGISSCHLPFIANPDTRLATNFQIALKVYNSQVKNLSKSPQDRLGVIEAENSLQTLNFVEWLDKLDEKDQDMIVNSLVKNFLPWRIAWSDSISFPRRPVFDGTMRAPNGCSLNDILPKGINSINNLVQIMLRWFIKPFSYHADISKMYNRVWLDKSHWKYQLYLWEKDLDPSKKPQTKVIKTCIYGLKSSGNQAQQALRLTAEKCKDEFPRANTVINSDCYVDDIISGNTSEEERDRSSEELRLCLGRGGFILKGFTFSGKDPDVNLSLDGKSVTVGGLKWFSKDDYIALNIPEINFARKVRGRKVEQKFEIPESLTKRECVSLASEIYDPTGKITPITASFKLDISMLHRSGLSWDDPIPENFREMWVNNFEMMSELKHLKYKRTVIPPNAKNLDIVTIDTGDASPLLICSAIYARIELCDGSYSCQLVFSRSKVLPEGITVPRAELQAATLNAATGYVVKKAFGSYHKEALKLSDSKVTLHWIASQQNALKTWVRSRVVEINRISDGANWYYVDSANMIADLGTRKGAKVSDVAENSDWINGLPWMSGDEDKFPLTHISDIALNNEQVIEVDKEMLVMKTYQNYKCMKIEKSNDNKIRERYGFSKYLVDPNKFRFRKVVRILAIVLKFVKLISKNCPKVQESIIFKHREPGEPLNDFKWDSEKFIVTTGRIKDMGPGNCPGGMVIEVPDFMLKAAFHYFVWKASEEVQHFVEKSKYVNISKEIDGTLYYSGRILTDYKYGGYPDLCGAALDLCRTSFCVPIMDQFSPVAISIALEIHWHHPDVNHKGIDAILRQMGRLAHIIGERPLAVMIKKGCKLCRIINKESAEVAMGPIHEANLCVAPPFYNSQLDIFGPFASYSVANKRATIKLWFLIFSCCTTGAIDIRVMEDYSTDSVILGFIRFSCRYGYPKHCFPDAGSQLLKSCEDMRYSFTDTKERLFNEYGIHYTPCPVGAHYVHGRVERKIREVKKSIKINVQNNRLSVIQWETLMQQIANSINNLPIGLNNKPQCLDNLDLLTPNRLILGRNNERAPNSPLLLCNDHKRLIQSNAMIFKAWFKSWMISYVPSLIERPKWHNNTKDINVGDVVLFLKAEKEYDEQYQYGMIKAVYKSGDGLIRKVDVEYRNRNENSSRVTQRGVRDLVIVFPVDELDIYEKLKDLSET